MKQEQEKLTEEEQKIADMLSEGGPVHPDQLKEKPRHPRPEPKPLHTGVKEPSSKK